ncbi:MAG TPA: TonB-dependent receptor [Steroidobacteraceae bacterium]
MFTRLHLIPIAASLALFMATGFAQTVPNAQTSATTNGGNQLEEIIVTAQRKSESAQHAAIPLSIVDGAALTNAGVTQADRLNQLVPALSIEPSSTGNLIFIRGVGNFTLVATSDPAVAFNYDGVYVGRPTSTTGVFYDLDRIEVLKGPQGILYGRNATGGAINVLPAQPKLGEASGYATLTYGNYNTINAEGAINVPVGDKIALRASATTANHDAYFRDGTDDQKTWAVRLQAKAEFTPDLTVRVAGDYSHDGGVGNSVNYDGRYAFNPRVPRSATPVPGTNYYTFLPSGLPNDGGVFGAASQAYRQATPFGPYGSTLNALAPYPYQDNSFYGFNADIEQNSAAGTVTVIPAFRHAELNYLAPAAAFAYQDLETDDQTSLEARFAATRVGIFDFTVGGFFYNETIHERVSLSLSNLGNYIDQDLGTKSYAGFGRLVANLTDRFRLVGGLRYTKDDKSFNYSAITAIVDCLAVNAFGAPNCPTAPYVPLFNQSAQLGFPFPAAGAPPIPVFTSPGPPNYLIIRTDSRINRNLSSSRTTYRGAAEFDLTPSSLLYASVESGYRSGGFSAAAGFETYQPEYITAYTLGAKNRFVDNRVQLNLEAFLWNYTNQQVNHVGLDIHGQTANYTQNVGKSRIEGSEVEARFLATPTTLLSADLQYLDAKQLQFSYLAGPGTPPLTGCQVTYAVANASPYLINCAGQPSYNSPRWTVNLAGQQTIPLGNYRLIAGVDTQYKSSRAIGFAYLPEQVAAADWVTNAQLSFGPTSEHWTIAAYVQNIEDNRVQVFNSTHPTANFLTVGTTAPRTFGLRVSARFGR